MAHVLAGYLWPSIPTGETKSPAGALGWTPACLVVGVAAAGSRRSRRAPGGSGSWKEHRMSVTVRDTPDDAQSARLAWP